MGNQSVTHLVRSRVAMHADRTIIRHRVNAKWTDVSWRTLGERMDTAGLALLRLGVKRGEAVCILSQNCLPWIVTDLAIGSVSGITAAIYASNTPAEVAYIVEHSEARVLFVENKGQLDKVRAARTDMPRLERVVIYDPDGAGEFPGLITFDEFMESGRAAGPDTVAELESRMAALARDDVLTYIYTSGTTGPPKAAMLTHGNFLFICETYEGADFVTSADESLSILPLAHALERVVFYLSLNMAGIINLSDDLYKTAEYLREVKPTVLACVPRILEKVYERIQNQIAQSPPLKRRIFHWALDVGKQFAHKKYHKQPIPSGLSLKHKIAHALVFKKLQEAVGGRIRWLGSGGAPLLPEIAEFFTAVGMPVIQAWGMTETTAPATQIPVDEIRYDAVGRAIPGVEVRVTDEGELIVRGGNVFPGYYKNPEETAKTLRDGWCYTGDQGEIDADGFVHITGRIKELIITSGGKNIAPLNLEFLFTSSPFINQAVIVGDAKPYLTALFTLDQEYIRHYASERGIAPEGEQPLELHPKIVEAVTAEVEEKNKTLPRYETIKKFRIVPGEFTQETGELTPTMKIKKKYVFSKYANLIEEMYERK